MKHFDVGILSSGGHGVGGGTVANHYIETVLEKASESWPEDGAVAEKWQAVSAALTSAAEEVLGTSLWCHQIGLLTLKIDYCHC